MNKLKAVHHLFNKVSTQERLRIIDDSSLTTREKTLLKMKFDKGDCLIEIAVDLNMSPSAVSKQMHKIVSKLYDYIIEKENENYIKYLSIFSDN